MAITSSFQLWFAHCLKSWTFDFLRFKMISSMYKMDSKKYSEFVLKSEYMLPSDFLVLNFHAVESCFMPHFSCFLPSFLLHNGRLSYSKLMISSSYLFSWSMSLDSLISSFNPFLIFQHPKWFNLHPLLSLNLRYVSKVQIKLMARALDSI